MGDSKLAGIIEKLELVNFMCHAHLSLDFNHNINFIVGKNGSGKSAIMTALMVVLGSKANDTSRGKSLSSFIRLGCNQARVRVVLRNIGNNAFQQDRYGKHITITRWISKNSAKYTIETVKGVQSCTSAELHNMMQALNIRLPNPFAIMTQETMKTFFMSSNTSEMYDLVREGTGMKEAQQKTQGLGQDLILSRQEEKFMRKELEQIEVDYKIWLKKKEHVTKMERAKDVIASLEKEALWAKVIAEEAALKTLQDQLDKLISQKKASQQSLETFQKKQDELREKMRLIDEEIKGWKAEQTDKDEEQKKIKLIYESKDKQLSAANQKLQAKDRQIQVKVGDKTALQDSINKLLRQTSPEEVQRRHQKQQQREQMEQDLVDVQATRVTLEGEVERLRGEARNTQQELNRIRSGIQEQMQFCKSRKQELDLAKKQSGSLPPVYGHKMSDFLREVDRAHSNKKFSRKPIGPIGVHVKVRDQKWALAIESNLNSEVRSFFCNSDEDRRVLMDIWKRVMPGYQMSAIVVSPFQDKLFDVSAHKAQTPGDKLVNFMDMLEVKDPIVMNYLIDQKSIEHILLCDDLDYAMDIMGDIYRVPRNCSSIITTEAEQIFPAPLFRYYNSDVTSVRFLVASKEDSIRNMEANVREEEAKLAEAQQEVGKHEEATMRVKQELSRTQTQLKRVEEKEAKLKNSIRSYKEAEEEVEDQAMISDLQAEVENVQQQIKDLEEEKQTLKTDVERSKSEKKEQESLLRALIPGFTEIKNKLLACQHKRIDLDNLLEEERSREAAIRNRCSNLKPREVQLTNEVAQQERMVQAASSTASEACARINTRSSVQTLQQKIASEKKFVESMHDKLQEDPEEVKKKVQTLKLKITKQRKLIDPIVDVMEHLEGSLESRKHRYHNAMQCTLNSIRNTFKVLIRRQHFEGSLNFDHKAREMNIILRMKGKRNEALKNLSGGERSYTTIALILAVWEKLRIPFYMLDEFDVFMDMVNRRICSDMLVAEAKNSLGRQFMFFTPQEMQMEANEKIAIHKLADPRDK